MTIADTPAPDEIAPDRRCARCRNLFPVEPGTHPMELIGWWTCDECTAALLPARHRTSAAADTAPS